MIPSIGLMVGLYIITRCLSFILRTDERKENTLVIILSGITIIVTIFVIIDLFSRSASLSNLNW